MTKKKNTLKQMEMFEVITENGLSPNQYYLMCCIADGSDSIKINSYLELRALVTEGWVTKEKELTPKGQDLVKDLERTFSLKKNVTPRQLMGKDYKEKIQQYVEMFPNIKLPSNKAARSAMGNLVKNFEWFFKNHKDYDWNLIFRATAKYVNEHQKKGWKFMRTSQFFIRKNQLSDLADYCEMIKTNGDAEERRRHNTRVV